MTLPAIESRRHGIEQRGPGRGKIHGRPKAKGEADQTIRAAEGYRFERVNEAEGDAAAFSAVLREYVKSPEITRTLELAGVDPQHTRGPLGGRDVLRAWMARRNKPSKRTIGSPPVRCWMDSV